ncbi:TetR family transcriptional regulator [Serratia marcescens]|uniref:TetR/AcrR family transcriptional regulator n=1 Tax=Serratia marcescens TaxID=615 RepID=UPI001EFF076D|nr:TetR/AcrR family transcriptional regulator [Serratia marcescens]
MSEKAMPQVKKNARVPVQERAAARMAKVLSAAEQMLATLGPEKTSIPALAEAAEVPRAAIYPFFPDKYALFSHLTQTHMEQLTQALRASGLESAGSLHDWVDAAVLATARYYNAHPAASILLLRGAFAEPENQAHAAKNLTIGEMFRAKVRDLPELETLPSEPDVVLIAIELAFACMKYGYAREGTVSAAICREATRAVIAYLGQWRTAP